MDFQNFFLNFLYDSLKRPAALLVGVIIIVLLAGAGLLKIEKDASVDAFVPTDHPAAVAKDKAAALFGLEDPIVVGLAVRNGESVFTPARLRALQNLHEAIRDVDAVKKNDVTSLASENAISGSDGILNVDPILPDNIIAAADAKIAQSRFRDMPMLHGLLASGDETILTIMVPVEDPNKAAEPFQAISKLTEDIAGPFFETTNVAGVAAMNARLAEMVDTDTRKFVPAAVLTVLVMLFIALRNMSVVIGPLFVIAASTATALGIMGWMGSKYYLITTALPVVILAIAVADSLHILTFYLSARKDDPSLSSRDALKEALSHTFLPVTLTSITTIAAFIGLSFGAAMKPISEFGIYAACGVAAAWALSLTALPAIIVLLNLQPAQRKASIAQRGFVDRLVESLSNWSLFNPGKAIAVTCGSVVVLFAFASQAAFDYERQRYFGAEDSVRKSDQNINTKLGGINFLDIIVSSPDESGLMTPEALQSIQNLRMSISNMPLVVKVNGIDDYLSLMHSVLTDSEYGKLPKSARGPGQYMFLYEASGAPEDFKREIDYSYQNALVRAQLVTDNYVDTKPVVDQLRKLAVEWSEQSGLSAEVSGRVAVNEGWMTSLAENHFRGLGLALLLVFITSLMVFRSIGSACFAMIPIIVGVLAVYASMGAFNIDIAPATSMTAAIATGLGVDFGIHLISHMRRELNRGRSLSEALGGDYTIVGRACFYSAVALGIALMVLLISSAPPLRWFGLLVSLGAFGSLFGAFVLIPAVSSFLSTFTKKGMQHV